ncbi:MAG: hypothetical protein ACTSWN_14860 [Promethearchaeota archaeon]
MVIKEMEKPSSRTVIERDGYPTHYNQMIFKGNGLKINSYLKITTHQEKLDDLEDQGKKI